MTRHTTAIELEHRVLPAAPFATLDDYLAAGGGTGLRRALDEDPDVLIDMVTESGLRGRGGAGFPTGTKWRTVADYRSDTLPTTVVVNGAEGEPGTFKDRAILRYNPYTVLEGAVIAARAVGAPSIVVAVKETFTRERDRLRDAIREFEEHRLVDPGVISVVAGPREYLYGEETALLEVVAGRPPFPRVAPPWRRGTVEAVAGADDASSDSAATVEMAGTTEAPPSLVNNVETLANVPGIVARGVRLVPRGGDRGVAGHGRVHRERFDHAGRRRRDPDGHAAARRDRIDRRRRSRRPPHRRSPDGRRQRGAGWGPPRHADVVRGDESGRERARLGRRARVRGRHRPDLRGRRGQPLPRHRVVWAMHPVQAGRPRHRVGAPHGRSRRRLSATVTNEARCALAGQQQTVVSSLLALAGSRPDSVTPFLIAELIDIDAEGRPIYDESFVEKQPDWTYDDVDSGQAPVDRLRT